MDHYNFERKWILLKPTCEGKTERIEKNLGGRGDRIWGGNKTVKIKNWWAKKVNLRRWYIH